MSVKEIKEAMERGSVNFGIKQVLKNSKKLTSVFICKNSRKLTIEKLENAKVEFIFLKEKEDVAKELNLGFECEVFSIR